MIPTSENAIANWRILISDNENNGRAKKNTNKLNFASDDNVCKYLNCHNTFNVRRQSGLCDDHELHEHDLYLQLYDPEGTLITAPAHKDIIDALIKWSSTRNFDLLPFFSSLSFNTLGNVPDSSSLGGKTVHAGITVPELPEIFGLLSEVINNYFPQKNNSSYQPLTTPKGNIPAIVLAYTFAGLLICEEANRGDRWFSRIVRKEESKTTQLGAAMPLAYFAARNFPWGVEMTKSARNLTM